MTQSVALGILESIEQSVTNVFSRGVVGTGAAEGAKYVRLKVVRRQYDFKMAPRVPFAPAHLFWKMFSGMKVHTSQMYNWMKLILHIASECCDCLP